MKNNLHTLGNIPIRSSTLESLYPDLAGGNQKLRQLVRDGEIIRLKRGLYVVSPEISGKKLSEKLMANHIYPPSYVSMSSALRYYGIIPEAVYMEQSMTIKQARTFDTPCGRYEYLHISKAAFPIGIETIQKDGYAFLIASQEKALCDLIANTPGLNLRYLKEAREYLEDDIRLDMSAFSHMNEDIFNDYIKFGKKADSIRTIVKLLKYEQSRLR